MQMPKNIGPMLWSAAGGAAVTMIVGFGWGGWVTGGSTQTASNKTSARRGRRGRPGRRSAPTAYRARRLGREESPAPRPAKLGIDGNV